MPASFPSRDILLGLGVGLVALFAAALGFDIWTGGRLGLTSAPSLPPTPQPIAMTIATSRLAIPANMIRLPDQRRPGPHLRIDLALLLPKLEGITAGTVADFATTARDGRLVFVTLAPRADDFDTASRINTIYLKFLDPASLPGPDGLERHNFLPNTSYAGEELYFEPGAVHPFAARCYPTDPGQPPISCLTELKFGVDLLATVRLPYARLGDWRAIQAGIDRLLTDILLRE